MMGNRMRHVSIIANLPLISASDMRFGPFAGVYEPINVQDQIFEAACEGWVRANLVMFRTGVIPQLHPYDDRLNLVYKSDPYSGGVDAKGNAIRESWMMAPDIIRNGGDDCESLSQYLAAWYRAFTTKKANVAVYPPMVVDGRALGRHAVVWVEGPPLYTISPYGGKRFIRFQNDRGYIEDPSVALGMYDILKGRPLPERMPFTARVR